MNRRAPRQNGHSPTPTSPFLTIRLRHRFTTFWRVGTLIHNFGRCDSQVQGPDSHFDSQLLAGKLLEWRSLNRDRHSHGACLPRLSFLAITTHLLHHISHHRCPQPLSRKLKHGELVVPHTPLIFLFIRHEHGCAWTCNKTPRDWDTTRPRRRQEFKMTTRVGRGMHQPRQ